MTLLNRMRLPAWLLLLLPVAACDLLGLGDRFEAGRWEVTSSLRLAGSKDGTEPLRHMVDLTPEQARWPAATVFFSHFYRGARNPDVRFANGVIEGSFEQGRVDDIAGHSVPITGTYAPDRFQVTFGYNANGLGVEEVVEGRRISED